MTEEGRELLHPRLKHEVAVINPEGGGSRAATAAGAGNTDSAAGPSDFSEDEPDIEACLLYTSPSPRDRQKSRMPSSA